MYEVNVTEPFHGRSGDTDARSDDTWTLRPEAMLSKRTQHLVHCPNVPVAVNVTATPMFPRPAVCLQPRIANGDSAAPEPLR